MNRILRSFVCTMVLSLLTTGNGIAGQSMDEELKNRCGQQAVEYLLRYSDIDLSMYRIDSKNHYNRKKSTCYVLSEITDKETSSKMIEVTDLNENNMIGVFKLSHDGSLEECYAGEFKCKSEKEFARLMKPYLTQ